MHDIACTVVCLQVNQGYLLRCQ